ncbi:MAG: 2'-5' RNA ligase [Bacteriovoracaceae bacterium]|jgi:2'-5' RNA ligase
MEAMSGRLFLGVPISDEVRKKLKQNTWQSLSRYKKDKMTPAHNWHFTLAFIGQIPLSKKLELETRLKEQDWGEGFKLGIRGYGAFPSLDEGRVLWVGAGRGSDEISGLAEKIRFSLGNDQIAFDQKPFVPHLTLCRMRVPRNLKRLGEDYKLKQETLFDVDKFVLYESLGGPQRYNELLEIPLNN